MINKYSLLIALMIIIVAITSWSTYFLYSKKTKVAPKLAQYPDAIMEDVTAFIMDKEGHLKLKIVTPKMIHFVEKDTAQLSMPKLTLFRQSPVPWFITANYATSTQGIENVYFWDNVIVRHAADGNHPATLIKTLALLVHPNKKTAQTQYSISMKQPNLHIKATGMVADMNTGNIKLLSQIRGEYVPES